MWTLRGLVLILFLCSGQTVFAGLLTIYLIPSAAGYNFTSPRTFAGSTGRNYRSGALQPYSHAMYHLKCSKTDGDTFEHDELSGVNITALSDGNSLVLRQGYGLGTLFAIMPGKMETRDEVINNLRTYMPDGSVSFLQYKISSETCGRLTQFTNEYRERGLDRLYGQSARPRYGEGSNCTAFVTALLELAGFSDDTIDRIWRRVYLVPSYLVGGPLTGNFIPPRRFLLRPFLTNHWASPNQPHFAAEIYNTDNLHFHILSRWKQGLSPFDTGNLPVTLSYIENIKGFIIDARTVPTPMASMWLSR